MQFFMIWLAWQWLQPERFRPVCRKSILFLMKAGGRRVHLLMLLQVNIAMNLSNMVKRQINYFLMQKTEKKKIQNNMDFKSAKLQSANKTRFLDFLKNFFYIYVLRIWRAYACLMTACKLQAVD